MRRVAAVALLAVMLAHVAPAHRLDEYLQAALIEVKPDGVEVQLDLTPGVAVLPVVVPAIDRDLDGRISPEEERAYAAWVARDLDLKLDGRAVPLRVTGVQFPAPQDMREGLGTIRLALRAAGTGRELRFENRHMREASVYLVNCVGSRESGLALGKPERDENQRSIRFGYSFPGNSRGAWPGLSTVWLAALGIAVAGLIWTRVCTVKAR